MRTSKIIGLIGTGFFFCLTLQGISFLVSKILEDTLVLSKLNPLLTYGITSYGASITVLIVFIYLIKRIKTLEFGQPEIIKRVFLISISAYVATQLLGFATPFISSLYESMSYFDLKQAYYDGLNEHYAIKNLAIDSPSWIMKYVVIAILIFKEIKTDSILDNTSTENH